MGIDEAIGVFDRRRFDNYCQSERLIETLLLHAAVKDGEAKAMIHANAGSSDLVSARLGFVV